MSYPLVLREKRDAINPRKRDRLRDKSRAPLERVRIYICASESNVGDFRASRNHTSSIYISRKIRLQLPGSAYRSLFIELGIEKRGEIEERDAQRVGVRSRVEFAVYASRRSRLIEARRDAVFNSRRDNVDLSRAERATENFRRIRFGNGRRSTHPLASR